MRGKTVRDGGDNDCRAEGNKKRNRQATQRVPTTGTGLRPPAQARPRTTAALLAAAMPREIQAHGTGVQKQSAHSPQGTQACDERAPSVRARRFSRFDRSHRTEIPRRDGVAA